MPELSNLLRLRLGSKAPSWVNNETVNPEAGDPETFGRETPLGGGRAQTHPDADILTAYAEHLLPQDERNRVMNHLAACGLCREVVMLSLSQIETVAHAPVPPQPIRRWRFLWTPGFGLAASAVAVALVVGVLVERPRKPAAPFQSAKQETPSLPVPAVTDSTAGNKAEPASDVLASTAPNALKSSEVRSEVARNAAAKPPANLASAKASVRDDRATAPSQIYDLRANAMPAGAGTAATPPISIAGVVTGERRDYLNDKIFSEAIASEASGIAAKDLPAAPAPRVVSPAGMFNTNNATQLPEFAGLPTPTPGIVQKRTFAPVVTKGHTLLGLSVVSRETEKLLRKRPSVPIPASGLISGNITMGGPGQFNPAKEKSQSEEVAAAAPAVTATELDESQVFTRRALSGAAGRSVAEMTSGSSQLAWKVAEGKLLKSSGGASWVEAYPSVEGIEFSTVAPHGSEVWAGGRDAALVHSRDAGASWERVTLGASATGTIVKIEASSSNVSVTSSSGQSWSSADGGKSWKRQE